MAKQDKRKEKEKRDGAFLVRLAQDYEKPSAEHIKEREEAIRQQREEVKKRQEAIQEVRDLQEHKQRKPVNKNSKELSR